VHGDECPDDVCLSIGFSDAVVEEAGAPWTRAPWVARAEPTPRLAFAQARLAAAVARADAIGAERWANDALDALASDVADGRRRGAYRARPGDLDAVVAVCDAVDADPAPRTAIAQRARAVGRTSTQLTHAFRRYTGVSPHRFVITSRLSHAARVLDAGATVSQACYQSGFENLSHFVRTFQRAFGVRASAWRSLGLAERRRKVQDLRGRRA
jgi:AraC-like DNA-binding protein